MVRYLLHFIFAFSLIINFGYSAESQPEKVIVCLHGFMRTKTNMNLFRYYFKKEGWKVHSWEYDSRERYIHEHAEDLVDYLEKICEKYPETPVYFVTHSMGALIVRSAVNHPRCPEIIKTGKAVLVAPPNQGAALGRFFGKFKTIKKFVGEKTGQQLILTEKGGFEILGEFPSSMRVLVIAGTCGLNPLIEGQNDGKVGVDETRLSTPHEFITIFAGHSWICHTPKTAELAIDFFNQ